VPSGTAVLIEIKLPTQLNECSSVPCLVVHQNTLDLEVYMNKSVKFVLLSSSFTILLLLSPHRALAQATIKLERGTDKKTSKLAANPATKIKNPSAQIEPHSPIVLVQPRAQPSNSSVTPVQPKSEAADAKAVTPTSPECSWSLLLLNEVGPYELVLTGVTCLGCRIPTQLSQSTAGILGMSNSPSGPWTETLTVYTQLDFSGNGVSDTFYLKGQAAGPSTLHAQNPWASNNYDFQVQLCTCPDIPIVP
jgi:hypothetical protein